MSSPFSVETFSRLKLGAFSSLFPHGLPRQGRRQYHLLPTPIWTFFKWASAQGQVSHPRANWKLLDVLIFLFFFMVFFVLDFNDTEGYTPPYHRTPTIEKRR
jgi:hypothetical protein